MTVGPGRRGKGPRAPHVFKVLREVKRKQAKRNRPYPRMRWRHRP